MLNCQNVGWQTEFELKMKKYWIYSWQCTDQWVGLAAYFFNDEFACVSFQQGRKSEEEFEWTNKEMAEKVRKYIIELTKQEEFSIKTIDVNDEFDITPLIFSHDRVNYSVLKQKRRN